MVERVSPLPLKHALLLLGSIAHQDLYLRTYNVLGSNIHPCVIFQPRASILAASDDLGPKVEDALGKGLGAHELALKAHIADVEELGERVAAEEGLDLG